MRSRSLTRSSLRRSTLLNTYMQAGVDRRQRGAVLCHVVRCHARPDGRRRGLDVRWSGTWFMGELDRTFSAKRPVMTTPGGGPSRHLFQATVSRSRLSPRSAVGSTLSVSAARGAPRPIAQRFLNWYYSDPAPLAPPGRDGGSRSPDPTDPLQASATSRREHRSPGGRASSRR